MVNTKRLQFNKIRDLLKAGLLDKDNETTSIEVTLMIKSKISLDILTKAQRAELGVNQTVSGKPRDLIPWSRLITQYRTENHIIEVTQLRYNESTEGSTITIKLTKL